MAIAVMNRALRLATGSWLGQLVVLGLAVPVFGLLLHGASDGGDVLPRLVVALLLGLALLAASVRAAAARHGEILLSMVLDEVVDVVMLMPRLISQAGLAALPVVASTVVALQVASSAPLLGLLLVPVVFAVAAVTASAPLLATVAVVHGDRAWLPASALRVIRAAPLQVVLATCAGGIVATFAALPLVLAGLVLSTLGPGLDFVGLGIAGGAIIPWLGCGALALWRVSGATIAVEEAPATVFDEPAATTAGAAAVAVAAAGAVAEPMVVAGRPTPYMAPAPPRPGDEVPAEAWAEVAAWDVAVESGAVWGTWVQLSAAAPVALRITYSGQVPPELLLATEDGTWTNPGQVAASGEAVRALLPAGNTYVQLGVRAPAAQALGVTLLVAGAAAA